MANRTIRGAIISPDRGFRTILHEAVQTNGHGLVLSSEITVPFSEIGADQLKELRQANPELIILDLEDDAQTGIRLAQFLMDANPSYRLIAAGPVLSPELLMEAMRAGISEYIPKPVGERSLNEALQRMQKKLGVSKNGSGGETRTPGELHAFFSAKGGSGSTTIATNVAIHLQRLTGKKTLLVDLDLELGEVAVFLGMQPRFNFVDLIRNFHRMDAELLASYIERHESGVHLLSAPFHPEKAEAVPGDGIRKILHFLKQHYDYVVVDTSKSFSPATLATFEQADRIYLVTNVDLPSLRNIKRCLPLLERVAGSLGDRVRLVVNRYQERDPIGLDEVRRALGVDVYCTLANDYEAVITSINSGKPLVLEGSSPFTHDLRRLGSEIAGLAVVENGKKSRFGRLGRIFGRKQEVAAHE